MIISVVNHSDGQITDEKVLRAIRAINRQIAQDFEPYWSLGATLRLEGRSTAKGTPRAADMRGDAIIYLCVAAKTTDALGYHEKHNRGIPYGFVFSELSELLDESWSVTLSHEALELIGDPDVNLLAMGPHPKHSRRTVFHWYEMCDAVQDESYEIDGVEVSNFVLPLYFTGTEERGGRNDFLNRSHDGRTLRSFGVNPGGYIGFFDPKTGKHHTYEHAGDDRAAERKRIKFRAKKARRGLRYQSFRVK
ncbi:MAG: hypothetical protein EXR70_24430 [Deltaproteobacteria bacterium]|nr:hypothetical protein [Deltaproteobacteria bacterium]